MTCGGGPSCTGATRCCGSKCADIMSDPGNCGGCGIACPPDRVCRDGTCRAMACSAGCPAGRACCSDLCVDLSSDVANCGACGTKCPPPPNAAPACKFFACGVGTCVSGYADCDAVISNGCEAKLSSDPANCGACGNACPPGAKCGDGKCTMPPVPCGPGCPGMQSCCGDVCVDTWSDVKNCNGCGIVCPVPPHASALCEAGCKMGKCQIGWADCNGAVADGCEVKTFGDDKNCGGCGVVCGDKQKCSGGACVDKGDDTAFEPTVNPTYLSPGMHKFSSVHIPADVVVYLAGGGPEAGTVELYVDGDVVIDGVLDVSGGPGGQNTITSKSTESGRAGPGGFTGDPRTAMFGPACPWVAGFPGGGGMGLVGGVGSCRMGSATMCIEDMATRLVFAAPPAMFGGGGGVFTGYRAYGAGGGGWAGGGPGKLGPAYPGEDDCSGMTAGGGAGAGQGGRAFDISYDGRDGTLGETECPGLASGVGPAFVGGGGGGSIGPEAAKDLAVGSTFRPGSGGGGGSGDYLNRPQYGGTSGGGGGGGALRIVSGTRIAVGASGAILANGGPGGDAFIGTGKVTGCDPQPGAAGGGGSGGLVYLQAPGLVVSPGGVVQAVGGSGGASSLYATGGDGGDGGLGRIRLSVSASSCDLAGKLMPSPLVGCTPASGSGHAFVAAYPD